MYHDILGFMDFGGHRSQLTTMHCSADHHYNMYTFGEMGGGSKGRTIIMRGGRGGREREREAVCTPLYSSNSRHLYYYFLFLPLLPQSPLPSLLQIPPQGSETDQTIDKWVTSFSDNCTSFSTPSEIPSSSSDAGFSEIYHKLIHSPALETLLQLEHTYAMAVDEVIKAWENAREIMQKRWAWLYKFKYRLFRGAIVD